MKFRTLNVLERMYPNIASEPGGLVAVWVFSECRKEKRNTNTISNKIYKV